MSKVFKELEFLGFDPNSIRRVLRTHKTFDEALKVLSEDKDEFIKSQLVNKGVPMRMAKRLSTTCSDVDQAWGKFQNYHQSTAENIRTAVKDMGFSSYQAEWLISEMIPFDEAINMLVEGKVSDDRISIQRPRPSNSSSSNHSSQNLSQNSFPVESPSLQRMSYAPVRPAELGLPPQLPPNYINMPPPPVPLPIRPMYNNMPPSPAGFNMPPPLAGYYMPPPPPGSYQGPPPFPQHPLSYPPSSPFQSGPGMNIPLGVPANFQPASMGLIPPGVRIPPWDPNNQGPLGLPNFQLGPQPEILERDDQRVSVRLPVHPYSTVVNPQERIVTLNRNSLGSNFNEAYENSMRMTMNREQERPGEDYEPLFIIHFPDPLMSELDNFFGRLMMLNLLVGLFEEEQGLDEEAVNNLKKEAYRNDLGITNDSCSICLEEFVVGVEMIPLDCKHGFHDECIKTWLQRSTLCPLCKSDLRGHSD